MFPANITDEEALIETMAQNSFRDFHAKGLDYLCLYRSPLLTLKAYFFDGDVKDLPEVVTPHTHRYSFSTQVLRGVLRNKTYEHSAPNRIDGHFNPPIPFDMFAYQTPLNGDHGYGTGFSHHGETHLRVSNDQIYRPGEFYLMGADDIHTIQVVGDRTVILIQQFADVVPFDEPTYAFVPATKNKQSPSLEGLYEQMSPDYALKRYRELTHLLKLPHLNRLVGVYEHG